MHITAPSVQSCLVPARLDRTTFKFFFTAKTLFKKQVFTLRASSGISPARKIRHTQCPPLKVTMKKALMVKVFDFPDFFLFFCNQEASEYTLV